ncbi:hypothetical protein LEM8419_01898 [Neolewinella maritima]|uniref:Tetratricopeptide repeat protein n=1 Tax=Neolewinella maritima TaxID=1383882 RepID=A0ABN8F934_9BACT|nr:hypothetical protein [Neolewinella maritima]CAH1000815.1 hypothetical protein LEM8419_01898 [Neolewinella maritima]
MNTEDQDRIEEYLLGRSPDPGAFERELRQNPQLRQEMESTRFALDAITAGEDHVLKNRLRKLEDGLSTRTPVADTQTVAKVVPIDRKRRRQWVRYAAAAAVILFLAGYFMLRPAPGERIEYALDQITPYDNIAYSITKGGTDDADPRAAAYTAYEAGDYAAAEAAFNALEAPAAPEQFYLAQSLLVQRKYDAALPLLERLATTPDFNLAQESSFYAATARLGLGQPAEATGTLETIAADPAHPMQAEARSLLQAL